MVYRFHVTVEYHYDVTEQELDRDYETTDLDEAADIDRINLVRGGMLQEALSNHALMKTVKVRAEEI